MPALGAAITNRSAVLYTFTGVDCRAVVFIPPIRLPGATWRPSSICWLWRSARVGPTLAQVLAVLHERPAEPWTVESLAKEVHVSRATLARRFAAVVGEPPLTYLTRWRMHRAAQRLKYSTDTVEAIARQVGYTSEYAFNRAFARHRGQPPGRYRRHAKALS